MSGFDDLIGQVMASHDGEAPGAADLLCALEQAPASRPRRRVHGWELGPWAGWYIPLAAAVAVAAIAASSVWVGDLLGHGQGLPSTAARHGRVRLLNCPARYTSGRQWVPAKPVRVDGRSRLVPSRTPSSAVVCSYDGSNISNGGAQRWPLSARRVLTGGLSALAAQLSWQPRGSARQLTCTLIGGKQTDYLVGLTYTGGGAMWVTAADDPNYCFGAFNGEFATFASVGSVVTDAVAAGRWPAIKPFSCHGGSADHGRLGQDTALVPAGSTSLTICTRVGRTFTTGYHHLVSVLNSLPVFTSTHACHNAGRPGPFYLLAFSYPQGPAAEVTVNSGCHPEIDDTSLQSESASTVLPIIRQLLRTP